MATTLGEAGFDLRVTIPEYKASTGIDAGQIYKNHVFSFIQRYSSGVGINKIGAVYSGRRIISGADPLDLSGSLTSVLDGSVVSFPILMGIFLVNYSTTAGQTVLVGAGSNPLINWIGASGDIVKIGPSGFLALWNPIDGYAVTNATADVLNFNTAAGSPELGVLLVGRLS